MKILILGATGMLGHKLLQILGKDHEVTGTVRSDAGSYTTHPVLKNFTLVGNIWADDFTTVRDAIGRIEPSVIVNCIGIVKQLPEAQDPLKSITINALFPHQLAKVCRDKNIRLIHVSTDCVFSGNRGNYGENDPSDAEDLYGKSKFLGEVNYPGCLTLRTSIIGRELGQGHGLVEWFLSQKGKTVPGYKNAFFSGVTTTVISETIGQVISNHPHLHGIYQVASTPISKYDLLVLINTIYRTGTTIMPEFQTVNNRTLNGSRFRMETNIKIPPWQYMIEEMYRDPTPYVTIRGNHAK
jgi:dTDP-4-dehydrorhamnose reductase